MRRKIVLPAALVMRSLDYAIDVVKGYRLGRNPASLAVSSRGAEQDVKLQTLARMAECAFALDVGLDPLSALNWSEHCDVGFDCVVNGWRVDVKHTVAGDRLIWPVRKTDLFDGKDFDALALVIGTGPAFEIAGVVSKTRFRAEHIVAGVGSSLDPGTWFMRESELRDSERLKSVVAIREKTHDHCGTGETLA